MVIAVWLTLNVSADATGLLELPGPGQSTPAASMLGGAVVLAAVLAHAGSDLAALTRRRVPAT